MDYSAVNIDLWQLIILIGEIGAVILLANMLRRRVGFIRKSLMPTAVIAGFITLILKQTGLVHFDVELLEMITYHTIALGFIAMALRIPPQALSEEKDPSGLKSGVLIVSTYLIQGAVGLLITILLGYTIMPGLFKAAGILLPMGYGQGPGQANNIGSLYQQYGFAGGQSFGLAIAAAGYLCACIIGVIYLNILRSKKKISVASSDAASENVSADEFQDKNEIPISESLDRFTVQICLVAVIYLVTYLLTKGITDILASSAPVIAKTISPLLWGFNFIIGSLLALACRNLLKLFKKANLITRQYQNNYLLNRISGALFDIMIVCGIASIDVYDLSGLWLPFILLAVTGAIVTHFYLIKICKRLFPNYHYEAYFSMFGMLTGTISSGILLLREIDPSFKTPAANNLVTGSGFGIAFGAPILILTGIAYKSNAMALLMLGICVVYFGVLLAFMFKLSKKKPTGKQKG